MRDAENDKILWYRELGAFKGTTKNEFFILPQDLFQKRLNVDIKVNSCAKEIDSLILKDFSIFY